MALKINLYHEVLKAEQDRRRDPFKLATLAGIAIACLFIVYYLYRLGSVSGLHAKAGGLRAQWSKLEPQQTAAVAREAQLNLQLKANQIFINRLQGRFLWGPFLQTLAVAVPPEVQITDLSASPPAAGKSGDALITGLAAGQEPRGVAEKFRARIQQKFGAVYSDVSAKFDANSLDDSPMTVQMDGKTLNLATFRIRMVFKNVIPPAAASQPSAAPAAPAARHKK